MAWKVKRQLHFIQEIMKLRDCAFPALDVGTGTGLYLLELLRIDIECAGVDDVQTNLNLPQAELHGDCPGGVLQRPSLSQPLLQFGPDRSHKLDFGAFYRSLVVQEQHALHFGRGELKFFLLIRSLRQTSLVNGKASEKN